MESNEPEKNSQKIKDLMQKLFLEYVINYIDNKPLLDEHYRLSSALLELDGKTSCDQKGCLSSIVNALVNKKTIDALRSGDPHFADTLVKIVKYTQSPNAILPTSDLINNHRGKNIESLVLSLGSVAEYTNSSDAVVYTLDAVNSYPEGDTNNIIKVFNSVAEYTKSGKAVILTAKIFKALSEFYNNKDLRGHINQLAEAIEEFAYLTVDRDVEPFIECMKILTKDNILKRIFDGLQSSHSLRSPYTNALSKIINALNSAPEELSYEEHMNNAVQDLY